MPACYDGWEEDGGDLVSLTELTSIVPLRIVILDSNEVLKITDILTCVTKLQEQTAELVWWEADLFLSDLATIEALEREVSP